MNFGFQGGNNLKTVLKNCISGLLQNAQVRTSACADYKKTYHNFKPFESYLNIS